MIRTLADNYDNKRFNSPNDVAVDRDGRVYVSDPRYVGNEPHELPIEGVFLIDFDGFVIPLVTTAIKPNGLVLAPDEKTLYVSDNGAQRRVLIATDPAPSGKVGRPRIIHDFGSERGIDGMTVTTDGRIVAAAGSRDKAGVIVLSPDGKILALIPVPEDPANVEFGCGRRQDPLHLCRQESVSHRHDHDRAPSLAACANDNRPRGDAERTFGSRCPPRVSHEPASPRSDAARHHHTPTTFYLRHSHRCR